MVSILAAVGKHPESDYIIAEMNKPVPDNRLYKAMIKAACSHLIDCFGRLENTASSIALVNLYCNLIK